MSSYAPVIVSTYSRLGHLKETIESLKKNTLAHETDLFVFSDAPKPGDELAVEAVREYIKRIAGFRSVKITEREENGRVANNRGAMSDLLSIYGRIIFLEEDVVTAPGFLQFMNDSLARYENNNEVLAVCGYTTDIDTATLEDDAFSSNRFCAWGFGIWQDRFSKVLPVTNKDFYNILTSEVDLERLESDFSLHALDRFNVERRGLLDAFDIRCCHAQFKHQMVTVHPARSLVNNIGHDGSGETCGVTSKFNVDLWSKIDEFDLPDSVDFDEEINQSYVKSFEAEYFNGMPDLIESSIASIRKHGAESFSVWGLSPVSILLARECRRLGIKMTGIIDSWAEASARVEGVDVKTLFDTVVSGQKNIFVIQKAALPSLKSEAKKMDVGFNLLISE